MKRALTWTLLALTVAVAMPERCGAQAPPITGWDRVRFGMTFRQVRMAYPEAQWNEQRNTGFIANPAPGVVLAACHFDRGGCWGINVVYESTDQAAILRGLERRYGAYRSHDQRLDSERYFWNDTAGAVICMYMVTRAWLRESHLDDTNLANYEAHVSIMYLDRPGARPEAAWRPRPPL
jgi:hypothetical protein